MTLSELQNAISMGIRMNLPRNLFGNRTRTVRTVCAGFLDPDIASPSLIKPKLMKDMEHKIYFAVGIVMHSDHLIRMTFRISPWETAEKYRANAEIPPDASIKLYLCKATSKKLPCFGKISHVIMKMDQVG